MHAVAERVQRSGSERTKREALAEVLALLRHRVLALETNVERRYMLAPYVSRYSTDYCRRRLLYPIYPLECTRKELYKILKFKIKTKLKLNAQETCFLIVRGVHRTSFSLHL